jgi:hypothetical protein
MLKNVGMLLLGLGIGVAAVFAAKVTPDINDQLVRKHRSALTGKIAASAKKAYCKSLSGALEADADSDLKTLGENDGCIEKEGETADTPMEEEDSAVVLPSHAGIWRKSVAPWDKEAESASDTFMELMPNNQAVFYEVSKVGDLRSVRARGPYGIKGNAVTVSLCGVGKHVDIGCSTSVFVMNKNRLSLRQTKIATGRKRARSDVEFIPLERTPELTRKYEHQVVEGKKLDTLKSDKAAATLSEELQAAREKWLNAKATSVEAASVKAGEKAPTPAGVRFADWFAANGIGFLIGMFLIIVGALMSRIALRREVLESGSGESSSGKSIDFGELLQEVRLSVAAHAEEMKSIHDASEADHLRIVEFIDHTKLKKIELLVEARMLLEVRYGVAGYASVFGPFSRAERYMNRCWAALVDSHWPEAQKSMQTASGAFADAKDALDKLISSADGQEPVA